MIVRSPARARKQHALLIAALLMACGWIGISPRLPGLQAASDARPLEQAFSCPVLDTFNRANGVVGPDGSGQTGNYAIASNQLDVTNTTDAGRIKLPIQARPAVVLAVVRVAGLAGRLLIVIRRSRGAAQGQTHPQSSVMGEPLAP